MKTGSQGKRIDCKNEEIQGFVIFNSTTHNAEEKPNTHHVQLQLRNIFTIVLRPLIAYFVIDRGVYELRMKQIFLLITQF